MPVVHPFALCTIMAITRQTEARSRHYALLFPNEFLVNSTIDSPVHSRARIFVQVSNLYDTKLPLKWYITELCRVFNSDVEKGIMCTFRKYHTIVLKKLNT